MKKFYEWVYYRKNPLILINFTEPNHKHAQTIEKMFGDIERSFLMVENEKVEINFKFCRKLTFYCDENLDDVIIAKIAVVVELAIRAAQSNRPDDEIQYILKSVEKIQTSIYDDYEVIESRDVLGDINGKKKGECSIL